MFNDINVYFNKKYFNILRTFKKYFLINYIFNVLMWKRKKLSLQCEETKKKT